jgi:hypothetical protein
MQKFADRVGRVVYGPNYKTDDGPVADMAASPWVATWLYDLSRKSSELPTWSKFTPTPPNPRPKQELSIPIPSGRMMLF